MQFHRSLFGTSVDIKLPPPRILALVAGAIVAAAFLVTATFFTPRGHVPPILSVQANAEHFSKILKSPKLSKLYNPFGETVHEPPPAQDKSSLGDTHWYTNLKWLYRFSSQVTLDADYALLPPLRQRTRIYTYYQPNQLADTELEEAENRLLLLWRRAWWAEGFDPVVLGLGEAKRHAEYDKLLNYQLNRDMRRDIESWMAWGHLGSGCLVDRLAFPMAGLDDQTLSDMRDPNWFRVRKYEQDTNSFFICAAKKRVNFVVSEVFKARALTRFKKVLDLFDSSSFETVQQRAVAFYNRTKMAEKYAAVAEQLNKSEASGLHHLRHLINAHLHANWRNRFPNGIALLEPFTDEMSTIFQPAAELADKLSFCPSNPIPASCPPNQPSCKTCKSFPALKIKAPDTFDNKSKSFVIGTVPHPYTFASLFYSRDELTSKFLRRETERDIWLTNATKSFLGKSLNGPQRLVQFKDFVANQWGSLRSLWLTAEGQEELELDWLVGFELPSKDLVMAEKADSQKGKPTGAGADDVKQSTERELFQLAKEKVQSKSSGIVKAVEAWNLADWEAWRFVRAFATQRTLERRDWEEKEKSFAGSESRSLGWAKWLEHLA